MTSPLTHNFLGHEVFSFILMRSQPTHIYFQNIVLIFFLKVTSSPTQFPSMAWLKKPRGSPTLSTKQNFKKFAVKKIFEFELSSQLDMKIKKNGNFFFEISRFTMLIYKKFYLTGRAIVQKSCQFFSFDTYKAKTFIFLAKKNSFNFQCFGTFFLFG